MADPGQGMDNSWRTTAFRQKVMAQIEEAVVQAGNPTSKSSLEMENHVFQKAKTREEYLALVARLIIHVREINSKKEKAAAAAAAMGLPPGQGVLGPGAQQDPMLALQTLTKQGMQQGLVPSMPGQQQMQQQVSQGMVQMGMQQQRPFQTYAGQPGIQPRQPMHSMQIQGPRADIFQMQTQQTAASGAMGQMQPIPPTAQTMAPSGPPSYPMVPSPAAPSSIGPVPSPANMLPSPSPQGHVAPSPKGAGAPSPGGALNTPGNPGSVGQPSPAPGPRVTSDEQVYLDKWKQLQKYIEPLKRMINRIDKDKDNEGYQKMKGLLDILSDSSKRVPMAMLLKCENVLEKLEKQNKMTVASTGSTPSTTMSSAPIKSEHQHMCQPLLDAVAQHVGSPMLNHTLMRTFGPAVQALHGTPIRAPSPPAKRQRTDDASDFGIPNVLQGEIARLEFRFKVNLDPLYNNGSRTVHLVCKLDDRNLPSVPPITVTVPENYPDSSPTCDTNMEDYDATPFLQLVQKNLASQMLKLPDKFSLTALLDTWEMSIRQACGPAK